MPGERVSMRKIREMLRLRFAQGRSQRAIGTSLGLSTGAVNSYLGRARMVGLDWPLADEFSDVELETLLYPPPPNMAAERRPVPDWAVVHRELRRQNVTLALLWEEYRGGTGGQERFGIPGSAICTANGPNGCSQRCARCIRRANECSSTSPVAPWRSSTVRLARSGARDLRRRASASSYTFAEAAWTQSWPDWIALHLSMLTFMGGVPR